GFRLRHFSRTIPIFFKNTAVASSPALRPLTRNSLCRINVTDSQLLLRCSCATTATAPAPAPPVAVLPAIEPNEVERKIFDRLLGTLRHFNMSTQIRVAGGWVRDKLLGKESCDIDIAIDNMLVCEFVDKVREYLETIGEEVQGIGVIARNGVRSKPLETVRMRVFDLWIDIVNFRCEDYSDNSFITMMKFGTAEEDAYRRDLTINSLFYNINKSSIEDFTGRGVADLKSRRIATPLPPKEEFLDDPLRVLRAIRFGARFEFALDEDLIEAARCEEVKNALAAKGSKERIGSEIDLMIRGNEPVKAMSYISDFTLYFVVFCLPPNVQPDVSVGCQRHITTLISKGDLVYMQFCFFLLERSQTKKQRCLVSTIFSGIPSSRKPKIVNWYSFTSVMKIHQSLDKFAALLPSLTSKDKTMSPEVYQELQFVDVPTTLKLRVLTGCLLRELKDLWRITLLISMILYPFDIVSSKEDSQLELDKMIDLFRQVEGAIVGLGLVGIWEMQPLLDGKDIIDALPLKSDVREWKHKLFAWQFAHPTGTADQCLDWLRKTHLNRAKTPAQQAYIGQGTNDCSTTANSALGYSCNGVNRTCQSYLTFRAQPPYTTVSSISTLLGSDPSQLAAINSVPETSTFGTNQLVLVPVTCSCSGLYYVTNSSFVVRNGDNLFVIANETLQGLSTCQAIGNGNRRRNASMADIFPGQTLDIPLRCACPTRNQTAQGINYLLSYLVTWGDSVSAASERFGGNMRQTLEANGLSEQSATIFPFTTLLIPLQNPPSSNQTLAPPPPPPVATPPAVVPPLSSSSNKSWVYVVAGVFGGAAVTLAIGTLVFCMCFRQRKVKLDPLATSESYDGVEKPMKKIDDRDSDSFFMESLSSIAHSIQVYTYDELVAATDNFSPKCLIKGSVYRGKIKGDLAAIKKMNGVDVSKEINLLNKINHSNIIRLSGVCSHDGQWYLVYEFAANGALSDWIYSSNNGGKALSWPQRIQIALDVALGLDYLHSFTTPPQVHKDIKTGNVLLDSDFRAKISGFAQARSASGQDGDFNLTRHIFGTKGYMAPEYLENGLVSTKIDVYAFGVVLLEIITGKEAATLYREGGTNGLSDILNRVVSPAEENLKQLMDPSLEGSYPIDIAGFVVKLVDGCLNKNSSDRPSMNEIVQSLSRILTASLSWELSNNISDYRNLRDGF
ncbi:LysM domain receptor-like kinase 4, partial [Linum perenne]